MIPFADENIDMFGHRPPPKSDYQLFVAFFMKLWREREGKTYDWMGQDGLYAKKLLSRFSLEELQQKCVDALDGGLSFLDGPLDIPLIAKHINKIKTNKRLGVEAMILKRRKT